jgi:hypothetical protein
MGPHSHNAAPANADTAGNTTTQPRRHGKPAAPTERGYESGDECVSCRQAIKRGSGPRTATIEGEATSAIRCRGPASGGLFPKW